MRLVLDTNTALSGLLWGGTPGRLIDAAEGGQVELTCSTALLAELQGVLSREKFGRQLAKRGITTSDVFDGYAALVTLVVPTAISPTITRDPADDQVLAAAQAAKADLIVSGDTDLLDLNTFLRHRDRHGCRRSRAPHSQRVEQRTRSSISNYLEAAPEST